MVTATKIMSIVAINTPELCSFNHMSLHGCYKLCTYQCIAPPTTPLAKGGDLIVFDR